MRSPFWLRALPPLARHVLRLVPWMTLVAGCLVGTGVLALAAASARGTHSPLTQTTVRLAFLPAVAALAFVPRASFRHLAQAAPTPAWLVPAGQLLLAVPVLAATCWLQLRLLAATVPPGSAGPVRHVVPLLAQLSGWSAMSVAAGACCDRSRYADLGGAVAAPISLVAAAVGWYSLGVSHRLVASATSHRATIAWCLISVVAVAVAGAALRDRWHRYTRAVEFVHRRYPGVRRSRH